MSLFLSWKNQSQSMKTKLMKFKLYHSILFLFVSLSIIPIQLAAEPIAPILLDVDYQLLEHSNNQDVAQLADLDSISHIEIFYWYGCDSCYQVEAGIEQYIAQNPHLSSRRTPLVARNEWRAQAYIQPLMEQLIPLDNLPSTLDIYRQCLLNCQVFSDFATIQKWLLEKTGSSKLPSINESDIWQSEKKYKKRAELFLISQVPTIIINETYKVDANQAKTTKRLLEVIDFLLSN